MRLEKRIVINQAAETVYSFVTDMHNVPLWSPIHDIRQESEGPIGVGATFVQKAEFLGHSYEGTIQITTFEPPRVFAFKLIKGPFPLAQCMTFEVISPQCTRLTLVGEAEPGGILKMAGPLLGPIVRTQLETQLNTLKRLLEGQK